MDLATLTAQTFAPHVGECFRVAAAEDVAFDSRLVEVTEGDPGFNRNQFSLVFRGGPDVPVPQAIYRLEHEHLGALDVFLVPIGPDGEGQRYQAVFS